MRLFAFYCVLFELRQACSTCTPLFFSLSSWTPFICDTTGLRALLFRKLSGVRAHAATNLLAPTDVACLLRGLSGVIKQPHTKTLHAEIRLIFGRIHRDALVTGSKCRCTLVPQSSPDLYC